MATRVLIIWADNSSANYGVRVLARGMGELARRAWGADTSVTYQDFGTGDSATSFGTRSILRDVSSRQKPIADKLNSFDVVIDSGAGDSFTDIYGIKRLTIMAYASWRAASLHVPVVMGPQTIGPFQTRRGIALGSRMMRRASHVVARDSHSANYSRLIGRPVDTLGSDVVFALPVESVAKSRDVIVNVSGLLWFKNTHVSSVRYQADVIRLVRMLETDGRSVSFVAHVAGKGSDVDDAAAIRQLASRLGSAGEVYLPEDLPGLRRFLASGSAVIGARMHACLNALSMGTPAVAWAYSRKFAPLMQDIGWDHVVDLKAGTDCVSLTRDILSSMENTEETERIVNSVCHGARARIDASVAGLQGVAIGPR